ncbi:MAG TPA: C40 family peptidase [Pyrinomonadaceae bacterium]|nr:C40 family peptidase [Pyrinomonadaceae bacterium]
MKRLFPCALVACFALGLANIATAQSGDTRARSTAKVAEPRDSQDQDFEDGEALTLFGSPEERPVVSKPITVTPGGRLQFRQLIQTAIDERLGSSYHWGSTGPNTFDCSGFVWSTFQSAGINFERASARTLWSRFEAPETENNYKFGTLVFFSNLQHVGIVADEHGFYHASRHHGVVYSPFNDYWLSRVDGFRRVPVPATVVTD